MAQHLLHDAIEQQVQVAYATRQREMCHTELQRWHCLMADPVSSYSYLRMQYELMYYTQQIERWQEYLACLLR